MIIYWLTTLLMCFTSCMCSEEFVEPCTSINEIQIHSPSEGEMLTYDIYTSSDFRPGYSFDPNDCKRDNATFSTQVTLVSGNSTTSCVSAGRSGIFFDCTTNEFAW